MKHSLSPLSGLALALALLGCGRAALDVLPPDGEGGAPPTSSSRGGGGEGGDGLGGDGGSGGVVVCAVAQECDDGDPCTTDECSNGTCAYRERDDDEDGVIADTCGGGDCNDLNPEVFPGHPEVCGDGSDNDCNGVADCVDPVCEDVPDCGCVPDPQGEDCDDGDDDDCDGAVDCLDADCVNTPACGCAPSEAGLCQNGFDDDCDDQLDCDDPDCGALPACQCQVSGEACGNGEDDDCDLLVDCADPQCAGVFPCACQPPGAPEQCGNQLDDDCDGLPDCADPQCFASPLCDDCSPEQCGNGEDDDCDLLVDCADPACLFTPQCPVGPEICNNGLDDDFDGGADCQDADCANTPFCEQQQANCLSPKLISGTSSHFGDTTGNVSETKGSCGGDAGEAVFYFVLAEPSFVRLDSLGTSFDSTLYVRTGACNSGLEIDCDDDSAGNLASELVFEILYPGTYYVFLDGFTIDPEGGPNEGPFQLNVEIVPNPPEVCDDGKDNDGDVYVDCADPDCTTVGACLDCNGGNPPEPEFAAARCTDGEDNDCDGTVDCGDEDCSASDVYVTECCDGDDDNGNNVPDDYNCRCANDSECDPGQLCYDSTVRACGIPCQSFFGDVCPFIAPGSFCNANTSQCEFP